VRSASPVRKMAFPRYAPESDTLVSPGIIVDDARQRVKALALFKKP
jgi:hypothetical protein